MVANIAVLLWLGELLRVDKKMHCLLNSRTVAHHTLAPRKATSPLHQLKTEPHALTSSATLAHASPLWPIRGASRGTHEWVVIRATKAVTAVLTTLGSPREPIRLGRALVCRRGSKLRAQATSLLELLPVVDFFLSFLLFELCHFFSLLLS